MKAKAKAKAPVRATIGLFGEPGPSKKSVHEWFVFIDCDVRRVGTGDESFDLATKAVRSLASMKDIPTGKSLHARNTRKIRLEVTVELTRARAFRQRLSPKERAKIDAYFDKLDAVIATTTTGKRARRQEAR